MAILKHVDFQVPAWGELVGGPQVKPGLVAEMLADNPVGLWLPDSSNTWSDRTGHGYNGTATAVTYSGSGPFVRMPVVPGVFDATNNSVVNVGTLGSLGSSTSISFECWFKTTTATLRCLMQASNSGGGNQNQLALFVSASKTLGTAAGRIYFGRAVDVNNSVAASTLNSVGAHDGNWHHVVGVIDQSAATITIYFDGQSVPVEYYAAEPIESPTNWNGRVVLGNHVYGNVVGGVSGFQFNGSMALSACYNTALSASRILKHYQVGQLGQ